MHTIIPLAVVALGCTALVAIAQQPLSKDDDAAPEPVEQSLDALRRGAPMMVEPAPPPMARVQNEDLRRKRGWPEQPPTIPHTIEGYQLDRNSNRCMVCHARSAAETFQAPMVSVTHYMDRNGQVLAQLSPRRFFCTQCHIVQTDARLLVENTFIDVDELLERNAAGAQ